MSTFVSRETGARQAESSEISSEMDTSGKTEGVVWQSEAQATIATSEPAAPQSAKEPKMVVALAPRPDRDRRARRPARLTAASQADNAAAPKALPVTAGDDAAWLRYAATPPVIDGPMIAIVIDDSGHNIARTKRLSAFQGGVLTFAFLPYVEALAVQTAIAREAGHEILLHLPMEPLDPEIDTGPNVLQIDLSPDALDERLRWNLGRLEGYVGINNHMGSRFTADLPAMTHLMRTLHDRGLLFLDSRTTAATVGRKTAAVADVPFLHRDIFLDNGSSEDHVIAQLAKTEEVARRQGYAIAIGHPHPWTIAALEAWAVGVRERGFALVPLTAIKKYQQQKIAERRGSQ
jgi:polysaccharide deacetylase 2 family uncharacterized protein YibQ